MEIVHRCCCGLDVHKKMIVACVIVLDATGQRQKETRVFGSMTKDILALVDWLTGAGCTHVAMESTGVYWKPIFNEARRDSSRSSWRMLNTSKRCLATRPT